MHQLQKSGRRHVESEPRSVGAPQRGRSRHVFAPANGPDEVLRLRAKPRRLQPPPSPAVSHWHSLHQGTGTFLAASPGSKLPVCALRSRASTASCSICSCCKPMPNIILKAVYTLGASATPSKLTMATRRCTLPSAIEQL